MKVKLRKDLENDFAFDKATLFGIFSLIIVITGMFGWLYEFIFYYFNSGMTQFYWRGGNFLPWINIYAIGSIMILLLTYRKRKNPFFVFVVSFFSTGILEYISGWGMDNIFHIKCWDYSSEILSFGNIHGYVCLRSVLIFGFCSLLLMYLIVPFCFLLARKMKRRDFLILSYTLCTIVLFDEFYNLLFARIFSLPRASTIYKKLGFNYLYFK